ncbi:MAG: sulfurtransferase complex subunit TusB [Gammaproteobacteria bacterium]|nr:MAG: sulfurtransferase complex subunit TusB [Gammaproteobacteria bacterium]
MLHLVNKSPFEKNSLKVAISCALNKSAILMIEDGVYGAVSDAKHSDMVKTAMNKSDFYVLKEDTQARGIDESKIIDGIQLVDYAGFVELSTKYDKIQSWV